MTPDALSLIIFPWFCGTVLRLNFVAAFARRRFCWEI